MRTKRNAGWIGGCLLGLCLGLIGGALGVQIFSPDDAISQKKTPSFPMEWKLGSNFYMQTAAEYRASCLQIYKCATLRLEALLKANPTAYPQPAVVMDLDETVFDNSTFETFLHQAHAEYSDSLWGRYEKNYFEEVMLVPGAKNFIAQAANSGVTVYYISNRSEEHRSSTIKALAHLGIDTTNISSRLGLKKKGESSDKTLRREKATARYNVLFYFGDNLRDFSETFAVPKLPAGDHVAQLAEIERRYAQVDAADCHWGVDWFVLPNPVYGEWEKLLGEQPMLKLRATKMKFPGK